jgi:hypothetical protein
LLDEPAVYTEADSVNCVKVTLKGKVLGVAEAVVEWLFAIVARWAV